MEQFNHDPHLVEPPQLKELLGYIWAKKWFLLATVLVFALLAIAVVVTVPNTYKAVALVAPTQSLQGKDALLDSQFGGIAALAGISLNDDSAFKTEVAVAKLHSKEFLFRFIDKYQLAAPLIALEHWDEQNNQLVFDATRYDHNSKQFLLDDELNPLWLAYKAFLTRLSLEKEKSGLMLLSFQHESPYLAKQVVEQLLSDINQETKQADISQADKSIQYLNEQLEKTELSDMRVMFFRLVEEQIKAKMLTEIKDEYSFTTIDPALLPEEIHSPQRLLILVVCIMLGGIFGVFFLLVRFYAQR